ncbi:hypothetical protein BG011_002189 [Mortierella polycephala]|uniref:Uncharacterized protein n=1 Tax=Mortierella polycephala TaxID=41804 RepID=A0A9P6U4B0_9FUNG|nr:hypothetical protein BG011_002189 [Mortierella polycephala]
MSSSLDLSIMEWEDPRDFKCSWLDSCTTDSIRGLFDIEDGVREMEKAESLLTMYNDTVKDYQEAIGRLEFISVPRYRLSRRFRDDGDSIRFKNDTNTSIIIMCTQDLVTVLRNVGAGVNAGPGGVDVKVDIVNQLVQAKEIKSLIRLAPSDSQDVLIGPKHALVSVSAVRGETMTVLYCNVLLKKGYSHTVEQKDVDNAIPDFVVKEIYKLAD